MEIKYKTTKIFKKEELENLFLSVKWSSGKYPEKLVKAMQNSDCVISAWDGDKLVGLINALSDGIMTAYFHYLLVNPDYQSKGIGKTLVKKILEKYENYARKVVIAYNKEIGFYTSCGFKVSDDASPLFITYLTT
jgi:GNAT superfamily N-acetyltransferase